MRWKKMLVFNWRMAQNLGLERWLTTAKTINIIISRGEIIKNYLLTCSHNNAIIFTRADTKTILGWRVFKTETRKWMSVDPLGSPLMNAVWPFRIIKCCDKSAPRLRSQHWPSLVLQWPLLDVTPSVRQKPACQLWEPILKKKKRKKMGANLKSFIPPIVYPGAV